MTLYQPLPSTVMIEGKEYPINTDFRLWIKFQSLAEENKSDAEKLAELSKFLTELGLPKNQAAAEAVLTFFSGVSTEKQTGTAGGKVLFDFTQDSEYIYSAFVTQYGIDLATEKIHWWRFKALFKALSPDTEFGKIMGYRGINMKDVPKEQKQFYQEMKKRYSLNGGTVKRRTAEEYARSMREHIKKRYAENGMESDN